jgi:hypothetical protein
MKTDKDVNGNGFMHLKKESMSKLWKLDSFMKESQRLTPTHLRMLSRTSLKTPFPDNQHSNQPPRHNRTPHPLNRPHPPNRNTIWLCCICHSPFPNLLELRDLQTCYRIRRFPLLQPTQNPRKRDKHQFVVTSSDSLNFGHGNHACPGRFFASNEIKVVLIELLRNWDFRFLEGKGRPENVLRGLVCGPVRPDTKGVMEFRRKKV